jgi:hypothetical protein
MTRLKPLSTLLALLAAAVALTPAWAGGSADRPGSRGPSPRQLWEAWRDGRTGRLATCVPNSTCPPVDQSGRKVQKCWYESGFRTGWRCILFCDYGGDAPWGSDGGRHCD